MFKIWPNTKNAQILSHCSQGMGIILFVSHQITTRVTLHQLSSSVTSCHIGTLQLVHSQYHYVSSLLVTSNEFYPASFRLCSFNWIRTQYESEYEAARFDHLTTTTALSHVKLDHKIGTRAMASLVHNFFRSRSINFVNKKVTRQMMHIQVTRY